MDSGVWPPRAGQSKRMMHESGYISFFRPDVSMTSTAEGAPRSSVRKMTFMLCGAMSPSAPLPKSSQPRQENGWYKVPLAANCFFLSGLRSEEHTSELQSHLNLVCRLLLEKKKKKNNT